MIAVLSQNPRLARMLLLEAERGGFSSVLPENAKLLLIDLDTVTVLPSKTAEIPRIGFSKKENPTSNIAVDFLLPLPYPTARLQQLLHRFVSPAPSPFLFEENGMVLANGKRVKLSVTERKLLTALEEAKGETVPADRLKSLLGDEEGNTLQVYIYRLRKKLSVGGLPLIFVVRGKGYRLSSSKSPETV